MLSNAVANLVKVDPSAKRSVAISPAISPAISSKFKVNPKTVSTNPLTNLFIIADDITGARTNAIIKLARIKPPLIVDFFQLLANPIKNPINIKPISAIEAIFIKFILYPPLKATVLIQFLPLLIVQVKSRLDKKHRRQFF